MRAVAGLPLRALAALALALALALPAPLLGQATGVVRGRVADSTGAPISGALVSVETGQRALTDPAGEYRIPRVPAGAHTVQVRRVGYASLSTPVQVTGGSDARLDLTLARLPAVLSGINVVVGSRAAHTAADELAVPVDVFTLEDIREQGTTETAQVLQQLAPSVNFPRQSVSDATEIVRPFTMRGLSPDHSLVLINGKRRHRTALVHYYGAGMGAGSSGVDMNALPASAIGRLEVLRDGASAQYGSDAIAGVVNVVLREGAFAPSVTVDAGQYQTADFGTDGRTIDVSGGWGIPLGSGSLGLFAEWRDRGGTNRAGPDIGDQVVEGDADVVEDGKIVEKRNAVPQPNYHWGDGAEQSLMTFANLQLPIGEGNAALYGFGGYSARDGTGYGYFRTSMDDRNWPQIYPLGFLPRFVPDVLDVSAAAGVRGLGRGWTYDAGASVGHNRFEFNLENTLNASLGPCLESACAPGEDGVLGTADDPGIPNQTSFSAGEVRLDETVLSLDVSRQLPLGLASPINVALGTAWRREGYDLLRGEPASYIQGYYPTRSGELAASGSQVFPGFRPEDEASPTRSNIALYADVEGDILPKVLGNVAARYEDYSDFGSKLTGKAALRVQPTERVTLRATASTGFRAPSLAQSYYSSVATNFVTDETTGRPVAFEVGTFPVASAEARALGARPLKAETSRNASAGIAVTPAAGFNVTADYYYIRVDDRILLSTFLGGDSVASILENIGSRATAGQYFTNALDTRTTGLDLTATWDGVVGAATALGLRGTANWTRTRIVGRIAEPPELAGTGAVLVDRYIEGGLNAIEHERPKWRGTLESTLRTGPWRGLARASYYGSYVSSLYSYSEEGAQEFNPEWVIDAEAGFDFRERLRLSIGARNLLDNYPDEMSEANGYGLFLYPSASPFGFNGRFLYTRLELELGGWR